MFNNGGRAELSDFRRGVYECRADRLLAFALDRGRRGDLNHIRRGIYRRRPSRLLFLTLDPGWRRVQ